MGLKIVEIRKRLREIDEEYDENPNLARETEEFRKEYSSLSEKELNKQFTV
jgi:hypothetical protein